MKMQDCQHPARELSRPILRKGRLICACYRCMQEVEIKLIDRPIGRAVSERIKAPQEFP